MPHKLKLKQKYLTACAMYLEYMKVSQSLQAVMLNYYVAVVLVIVMISYQVP